MKVGRLNKWVTLAQGPQDTTDASFEALDPEGVWAGIEPLSPTGDGRTINHLVTIRYHSGVTMDTRVLYGSRSLFVKGFQNVNEQNDEMRLLCEEIIP
jgi:head-tail adaptor